MSGSAGSSSVARRVRARVYFVALAALAIAACSNTKPEEAGNGSAGREGTGAPSAGAGGALTGPTGGGTQSTGAGGSVASGGSGVSDVGGGAGKPEMMGHGGMAGSSGGPAASAGSGASPANGGSGAAGGGAPSAGGTSSTSTGGASGAPSGGAGAAASAGGTGAPTGTPTLFWLDVSGKVMRSDVAKFAAKTIVPSAGQGSDGIAVDVPGGHIYWTDMGVPADNDGSVMRSDLDGSNVTTIVPKAGTWTPKQLKLEPTGQKLYWADREGMRIMRSNLDGSNVETLYASGMTDADRQDATNWCVGIAVDTASGYFYWTQKGDDNGHTGTVRRAHLAMPDGDTPATRSDIEILFQDLAAPCDMDLDLSTGLVYWANRGDNTINRGPIAIPSGATAATRMDREAIVPNVTQAIGVALDHERGIAYYTDAVGDVGSSGLDGKNAQFLLKNSGAFTGIVIVDLP